MKHKDMSQNDSSALPVAAGAVIDHGDGGYREAAIIRTRRRGGLDPIVEAQRIAGGEKRGLKGGTETLNRAKSTYLSSEYSGENDRRPRAGLITRKEI